MGALKEDPVVWGVASFVLPGQVECGDLHVVAPFPNGVLLAVIDGLGHGRDAATAARIAAVTLSNQAEESVIPLVRQCHERLLKTRGVAMTLASFNGIDSTITWLGVGNVEGFLLRSGVNRREKAAVLLRGGVVGYSLPPLRAEILPVACGDTLVLATDGIRSGFADALFLEGSPQQIADQVLTVSGNGTDDALVLVARFVGHTG